MDASDLSRENPPAVFILDCDGVLTDGRYYYTAEGKVMKRFGADDNDALSLLRDFVSIHAVSGDRRGFEITRRRVATDMGIPLDLVSTAKRIDWIRERFEPARTIYMGDGFFDGLVFEGVGYGIAPSDADERTRALANYVTHRAGGDRAVAEAVVHIIEKFFGPFDLKRFVGSGKPLGGIWSI